MKFKGEENAMIWESFRGKTINERLDDELDMGMEDDFSDDEFGDDFEDDGMDFDDGMSDDLGGGEAQGMVMEIDPVAPVEPMGGGVSEEIAAQLKKLAEYAKRLYEMKDSAEFEDWQVTAITVASTYVSDVWHRLDAKADFANTGFEQADDFSQF
jgi:hypothetical protein